MSLQAGMMVGANVRLVRMLGQGGMGSVWVADHLTLHTQVAVKFMATEIAENAEAFARFTREAAAAAQIKSPHVVQTFDHGRTAEGIPFIVMELLEGEDLAQRVARTGALAPDVAATVIGQVCKALGRAHALGIVHRDIKPENIYLTDSDGDLLVKVLDFGIAKRSQDAGFSMTTTGAMVGTPYYMSPEQVMSAKSVDLRSDLWSLAVVAYHALTGKVPFDAETIGALCVSINLAEFQPPSLLRPGLGPALDAWFKQALSRDPNARFQSAKELAAAFQQAAVGTAPSSVVMSAPASPMSPMSSTGGGVPAQSVAQTAPLLPSAAGTLMEASITSSRERKGAGVAILLAAGGGVLVVILLVVGVLVFRGRGSADASAPAQIEAVPAAPAESTAPVEPAAPPPSAAPPSEPEAPAVAPSAKPVEPKAEKPRPTTKQEATTKPAPTKEEATTKPTPTKPAPVTTKPKDKYGF